MSETQTAPSKKVIHSQMTIEEILSLFPNKAQKLSHEITHAGLHCVGCHAATWETLEAGMLGHGKTKEEMEKLIARLNALLAEPNPSPTQITLTKKAAQKFMSILEEEGKLGWGLRFGDRMAGCSGFEYVLDFSEKPSANDAIFESEGIQIHVDKSSVKRLIGSEIDYIDSLHNAGFKVSNDNAKSSCGCGSSHNYS